MDDPCLFLPSIIARSFLRVTVLTLPVISGWFLVKGTLGLTVGDIARLATAFGGGNALAAENVAHSIVNTRIGTRCLLASFALQIVDQIIPQRICDIDTNPIGMGLSLLCSVLLMGILAWRSRIEGHAHAKAALAELSELHRF